MGYIYILTSPSGKSYIGQTIRSIERRLREHQQRDQCVAIYNAIRKYGWDNFEKDWYECPDEDLNFDEDLLVSEMGTLSPEGYNLREGGGSRGKMSEDSKQKMSEAQLGEKSHMYGRIGEKHPRFGETHTEETIQKMIESKLGEKNHSFGKTPSEDTRQKISDSTKGEKNHKSKKVYQYDLEGKLICSFGSTREAGRYLKKDGTNIRKCARGKLKNAHGFKWSYSLM